MLASRVLRYHGSCFLSRLGMRELTEKLRTILEPLLEPWQNSAVIRFAVG